MLTLALIHVFGTLPAPGQQSRLPHDELPAILSLAPPRGIPSPWSESGTPQPREAAVRVGRRLFFDPALSADRSVSCASCHQPAHGFASPEPAPAGVHGRVKGRNAPTLFNRALGAAFSWDGRAPSLAAQVLLPIEDPDEMGLALDAAIERVRGAEGYAPLLREAFGEEFGREQLSESLAGFVSTLWIGDSAVDRFRGGDAGALEEDARQGLWLFESRAGCWRCHEGPNFSDEGFHNTGVGAREGVAEAGRMAVTSAAADRGRFKTPTLRGLARTAPYMHDGSLATLEEVVRFYGRGGNANASLDPLLRPVELSEDDVKRLVAFLETLSRPAGER